MNKIAQKTLVFLDTETSGLDPQVHEILEIAIVDPQGEILLHSKIKPQHIESAHPKALEINGYNEADWKDAPSFSELAPNISSLLRDVITAGHNPAFDLGFIKAELSKADPALLKGLGYHLVDTVTLAYEQLSGCGLDRLSLVNVAKFLGIQLDNAHTALADAEACRQVYLTLARATAWDRFKWKRRNRRD
jgi:DNA polymerase III epsilon subunit-like protein